MPDAISMPHDNTPQQTESQQTDNQQTEKKPRKHRWVPPLGVQSLIGLVIGALIGVFWPETGSRLKILGDLFLNGVKMVVVPLVFPLVVLGISKMGSASKIGRIAVKAIIYFEIVTTIILFMAVFLAKAFDIGANATISGADASQVEGMQTSVDWAALVTSIVPDNVVNAFAEGDLLAVIFFSVLLGIALAGMGEKGRPVMDVLDSFSQAMFKLVDYVIRFAPFGIVGFLAYDTATYGLSSIVSLLSFVGVVYLGLAVVLVVIFPIIALIFKVNYLELWKTIYDLVLLAFLTRSSESVLAALFGRLEKLGISEGVSSFVVPLGYSFNTDGSVLYQAVALVYLANAYHTGTSLGNLLVMVGVLVIMSKGMAGVAAASIVVLVGAAQSMGIPTEGVALLLGVDFIVDMARTAVNVVGNSMAASVVDITEKRHDAKQLAASAA